MSETILQEAQRLVHGDRQAAYGHPADDFAKTAALWTVVFGSELKPGGRITAQQVALAMVCVKISRQLNAPKRDNLVDGAGYFATLDMVETEFARRAAIAEPAVSPVPIDDE